MQFSTEKTAFLFQINYMKLNIDRVVAVGFLRLILGFIFLISVLVIVTFGHGLAEPIWNLSYVFPRTVLLIALLILPRESNKISLDSITNRNKI